MKATKKLITSIFTASILFALTTTTINAKEPVEYLRVGINYGFNAVSEYTLSSESGFFAGTETDKVFDKKIEIEDTTLVVKIDDNGIITYADNTFDSSNSQHLTIMPADDNLIEAGGKSFRGGLQFLGDSNGKMSVVNYISVDDYVKGVVPREVSASWHEEALKAQAICARNYSVSNIGKHSSAGFDVCTTVHCQVYGGVAAEDPRTNKAVEDTAGQYLMYNGSLAETLFFSSSGGHTGNSIYVWGSDIPYLSGVENDYESPKENPRYTWSVTLTAEQISQKLATNGHDIGAVKGIIAKSDDTTGQVYNLIIEGTSGTKTYTNDGTRGCFGSDVLYSQFYTVSPITTPSASGINAISSNGKSIISDYYVLSGNGNKTTIQFPFVAKSSHSHVELTAQALAYRFDGRGWGHGLGMSQYGAKGMADQGYTYEEILYHYYPGTNLK